MKSDCKKESDMGTTSLDWRDSGGKIETSGKLRSLSGGEQGGEKKKDQ